MASRIGALRTAFAAAVLGACSAALLAMPGAAEAAFPGENGGIVFQSFRGWDDNSSLYSRDPDTGAFTRLTDNTTAARLTQDGYPAVSPDGTQVVFVRITDYNYDDLYVANADGTGGLTNLTNDPAMAEFGPTWSPDGRRVAFAAYPTDQSGNRIGDWEVYAVDADGTHRKKITDNELDETQLAWSPDGTRIAFYSSGEGTQEPGVHIMDADGSDAVRVAVGNSPSWSPDGRKLAYSYGGSIHTMNADGSDQQEIVTDRFEDNPDIESVYDGDPAWSPDGTRIAFARTISFESSEGNSVYTTKMDGSDLEIVAGYFPRAVDPDWGPAWGSGPPAGQGPPETTIIKAPSNTAGPSAVFDFVASRPDTSFECSLDGAEFSPCEGAKRYEALPAGDHEFAVRAKGSGGTVDPTPAERTWTVKAPEAPDTTDPTITRPRPEPGSATPDRTPALKATVRDAAGPLAPTDLELYLDGSRRPFSYDPSTGRLSRQTGRALALGWHRARVEAEDAAGNRAKRAWSFKVDRRDR